MRVLAIAGLFDEPRHSDQLLRKFDPLILLEPPRDRGVIGCGQRIGLARELAAQREVGRAAFRRHVGEHRIVIGRVGHHRDEFVVLRRGADQGDAADIDVLDAVLAAGARCHHRGKRIEVRHQQVDLADAVLGQGGEVVGPVAPRQQAAMDRRVQGLDPAVEHLRGTGHRGDLRHRQPSLGKRARRVAGRNQRDAMRCQSAGERHDPGLVVDRDQRAADRARPSGRRGRHRGHSSSPEEAPV